MFRNTVTQPQSRRKIERILCDVIRSIATEKITGLALLMFEIDTHVKIHFGIHAPQRNFTPMGLIPAARNVAVIFIGDRQTQRIELDIFSVFVYIIGIGIGIAVVVTVLIYKIQVVMIRQRFHISNPCVIRSS